MAKDWDGVKHTIIDYYQGGRTLKEVMVIMRDLHGFKASQRSYRQKFRDWGVRKYRCHEKTWSSASNGSPASVPQQQQQQQQQQGHRTIKQPNYSQQQHHHHHQQQQHLHQHQHQHQQQRQQHQQQHFTLNAYEPNTWSPRSPPYGNNNTLVPLRTPESESGKHNHGFASMLSNMDGHHKRSSSNLTAPSSASQQQQQQQLSPWGSGPVGTDGQVYPVSLSSPLSMPATASPCVPPQPLQNHTNSPLMFPSNHQPWIGSITPAEISPMTPHHEKFQLHQAPYNQPQHAANSCPASQPQPSQPYATAWNTMHGPSQQHTRNLQAQAEQRHSYLQMRQSNRGGLASVEMYPEHELDPERSVSVRYRRLPGKGHR